MIDDVTTVWTNTEIFFCLKAFLQAGVPLNKIGSLWELLKESGMVPSL